MLLFIRLWENARRTLWVVTVMMTFPYIFTKGPSLTQTQMNNRLSLPSRKLSLHAYHCSVTLRLALGPPNRAPNSLVPSLQMTFATDKNFKKSDQAFRLRRVLTCNQVTVHGYLSQKPWDKVDNDNDKRTSTYTQLVRSKLVAACNALVQFSGCGLTICAVPTQLLLEKLTGVRRRTRSVFETVLRP